MRNQIWRFFQKLGAVASATYTSNHKKTKNPNTSPLNPINFFTNKITSQPIDPDNMYLRYSLLAASCVTVAFFIIKLFK